MLRNWLRRRTQRSSASARRVSRTRSRLWLEVLEDRTVLSTINWKNNQSGLWNTASNWDSGTVPTATDDAVISFSGITVTHSSSTGNTVHSLTSSANLVISGGSLSFTTASTVGGTLTVSAGTLGGAGGLTVSGLVTWSGGTLTGAGHLAANGGMSIDGTASLTLTGKTIDNGGTANRTAGTGLISASNGAVFNNLSTGTLNLQDDNFIQWTGTGAVDQITNAGTLKKTGGTGNTRFDGAFTNSGSVNVQSGTLELDAGGSGAGSFAVSSGDRLLFNGGTYLLSTGAAGTGAGTFELSSGTVQANGNATFASLLLDGATLTGSANVTVSGQLTWNAGQMTGTGHTKANGPSAISGGVTLSGRTFDNAGSSVWTTPGTNNAYLGLYSGGVWNNLASGTVDMQSEGNLSSDNSTGNAFNNAGIVKKSVGTFDGANYSGIYAPFNNNIGATAGTLSVLAGELDLIGGGSSAGGSYTVSSGTDLAFDSSTHTLNAASSISGAGQVQFAGGEVDLAGSYNVTGPTLIDGGIANFTRTVATMTALTETSGSLEGSANVAVSGLLTWSGGYMSGTGHTKANGPSAVSQAPVLNGRTFDNAGTSVWTTTGTYYLYDFIGGVWNNLSGSTVDFQSDGYLYSDGSAGNAFNNAGTLKKSVGAADFSTYSLIYVPFNNNIGATAGTVSVLAGLLDLAGGSSSAGGSYKVSSGADLYFGGGTHTLDSASSISGAGEVDFASGEVDLAGSYNVTGPTYIVGGIANFTGTVMAVGSALTISSGTANFNSANVSVQTLSLTGGTLEGSGNVTVSGLLTWSGGTMTGTGHTKANGPSTVSQQAQLSGRTFDNAGTSVWTTTYTYVLYILGGAVWNNLAGSTVDLQSDSTVYSDGNAGNAFNNAGTLKKSVGAADFSTYSLIYAPFNNNIGATAGTVSVLAGLLALEGGGNSVGGSYTAASGTDLYFGGGMHTLDSATSISGAGEVDFASGEVDLAGSYNVTGPTYIVSGIVNFTGTVATMTALTETGGTLEGSANVTVSGLLTWSGGTMSGTGHTRANGPSAISQQSVLSGRTFDNAGTSVWTTTSTYYLLFYSGGVWNNLAGSTVDMQSDGTLYSDGNTGNFFNNAGTLKKSVGAADFSTYSLIYAPFNNNIGATAGTVSVLAGLLDLAGGGSSTGGSYTAASSAALYFGGGTHTLDSASSISGAGEVDFGAGEVDLAGSYNVTGPTYVDGGISNFTGTVATLATLTETAGTLEGSTNVTVSGLLTWSGGTMTGTGHTRANGPSAISQQSQLSGRTFDNAGSSVWTTTSTYYLLIYGAGVWNNLAGSTVDMQTDGICYNDGTVGNAFNNAGTVKKSAGTATSEIQVPFSNAGTLSAQTGKIYLSGGLTNLASGTLTGGTYLVTSTLQINGTNITTDAAAITLSGTNSKILNNSGTSAIGGMTTIAAAGSLSLLSGRTISATGAFNNAGAVLVGSGSSLGATGQYKQTGGSTTVQGALTANNGVSIQAGTLGGSGSITGNVTNAGTVAPGSSPGILSITGNYTQSAGGTLAIEVGGTTVGTGFDRLAVSGTVSLAGTLALSTLNSFVPGPSNTFKIVTGSSVSGSFATITGTGLPQGESFKVNLNAADVTLSIRVLAASGTTISATEGAAFSGTVATFTTTDTSQPTSDFSASVVWGDGHTSAGSITGSAGSFTVSAGNTYAEDGSYPVSVTVSDTHWGSSSAASSTVNVADAGLSGTGVAVTATEGAGTGIIPVATFTDLGGPEAPADYSASIDWGDGQTSAGSITRNPGTNTFTVHGTHTYTEDGSFTVAVHITHEHGIAADASTSTATVADAALSASGQNLSGQEATSTGTVTVATFTDQGGAEPTADYGATIDWGDGTTDTGTIVANGSSFNVQGSHTYADNGSYSIAVHITHENGITADTSSTATIANVAPTAGVSGPGDAVPGQSRSWTFSATDPSSVDQAAGFTFNVAWGDGTTSTASGTSPQSLNHAYTATGSYTISVTATDKDGGTSMAATEAVSVVKAELQGADLAVGGTTANDNFTYTPGANAGDVVVTLNGTSLGTFHPTGVINTYGGSGTDSVVVNGTAGADSITILPGGLTLNSVSYNGDSVEKWQANGQGGNDTFTVATGGAATLDGGTGTNTLVGPNGTNAWVLTAAGAGTLNGANFLNMQNLTGGTGTDSFKIKSGASVTGTINGGGGTGDRLDFSLYGVAVTVNLQTKTAPGMGHFANITALSGSTATDTLIGANVTNTWQITANNSGKIGSYSFGSFENLTGGTGNDTFKLSNGKGVAGVIDGGTGTNTLDYTAYTTAVAVTLADSGLGSATNITGGIANIQNVTGGAGNDTLTGNSADNVLIGNAGNDVLNGGPAGNDILVGGAGNDSLTGGSGRSLLLGGGGADTITGGGDDDILIAGTTSYDANTAALVSILNEWKRTDEDYTTRISHIRNGGGVNGTFKFNSSNVHNDSSVDSLTGGAGMDWFWASLSEIHDLQTGEQVN
jgi:hypothetical protein